MIHVAGGTYLEFCREPYWHELYGSGLRASLTLNKLDVSVCFSTFVGKEQKSVLAAKAVGIKLSDTETSDTVLFSYLHPLSKPTIEPDIFVRGCQQHPNVINVEADNVLRFGVVEGSAKVKARMATYDPQTPSDPRPFTENGSVAERLAVVANRIEAKRLTGQPTPEKACQTILNQGAEVAIVKCGTAGCVVATAARISRVPAYRTNRVWPIGSGDVFSALFAHGWMELGLDPVEAATVASKGTSHYVETQLLPQKNDLERTTFQPLRHLPPDKFKKIYLAGPFFNLPQRWLIEEFKDALANAGVQVFSPLHDVGRGSADDVYAPDIEGLKTCPVVLACLDGLDPGTIYEVGYAHSLGAKVIAFVSAERMEDLKMVIGGGSQISNDFATALYLTVWAATCE
jgi:nucleoside 2-deoxyribosyltransferase